MKQFVNRLIRNRTLALLNLLPVIISWFLVGDFVPYIMILVLPIYLTFINFRVADRKGKPNFLDHYIPSAVSLILSNLLVYMQWVVSDSQITLEPGIILLILIEILISFLTLTGLGMYAHMFLKKQNQNQTPPQAP